MTTVGRSAGKQSTHDRVIALVAERWAKPLEHNIATNPGSERNRWAGSDDQYPTWSPGSGVLGGTYCGGWRKSRRRSP